MFYHESGAAAALFASLEHQLYGTLKFRLSFLEQFGSSQQHRCMCVVTAGMGDTGMF